MADAPAGPFSIGSDLWPGTSKLIEEMGELAQVLGKLIALGGQTNHWDGTDLRERLHDELADVIAAVNFFLRVNRLDPTPIDKRAYHKYQLFAKWQRERDGGGHG